MRSKRSTLIATSIVCGKRDSSFKNPVLFCAPDFFYQCDLVTEKCFVLRYDKATIKKELANVKINLNPDQEIVSTIRKGLKRTGGYCPCRRERTEATKCMCQEFKNPIADPGFEGVCHCMLYYKSL